MYFFLPHVLTCLSAPLQEILDTLLKSKPEEETGRRFTPKGTPRGGTPMRNRALPRLLPKRSKSHGDER